MSGFACFWVLFAVGWLVHCVWMIRDPRAYWRHFEGWRYKSPGLAEPSDAYLRQLRVLGVLLLAIPSAAVLWFVLKFGGD